MENIDMDNILQSIKKMLGPSGSYEYFDADLQIHINTVLFRLTQMGVGPSKGFSITDGTETWDDFISDIEKIEAVKTYVYLKVKLIFDPPQSSIVKAAIDETINELEFCLNVAGEEATQNVQ